MFNQKILRLFTYFCLTIFDNYLWSKLVQSPNAIDLRNKPKNGFVFVLCGFMNIT